MAILLLTVDPTHGSSALVEGTPTCKRLITYSLPHEVFSLIEAVLTSKDEVGVLASLRGDAAQIFIDTIDEVRPTPHSRGAVSLRSTTSAPLAGFTFTFR